MASAAERGWGSPGAPGTPSAAQYRKQHIVTIDVGGIRLAVRREVAPLFAGFIRDIVKQGYDLSQHADDWGYICRYIRGYEAQQILSNHAWGLAVDLNASEHPMGKRGTGVPAFVVEAAHRWGLFWGGDYKTRPDEMHFEFLGTPADAARIAASAHPTPAESVSTPPSVVPQEDLMAITYRDPRTDQVFLVEGGKRLHLNRPQLTDLQQMGAVRGEPEKSLELATLFDAFPLA